MTKEKVFPRTTQKQSGGIVLLRNRGLRTLRPTWVGCTTPDEVFPRTTLRQSGGTVSLRNRGMRHAQTNLGWMYENGRSVPQDDAEAVRWYRLAAEQGHADAQFNLGVMYDTGRGVSQDYAEAVRWYRLAAEQGHAIAQRRLDEMLKSRADADGDYQKGLNAYNKRDYATALRELKPLAEQGDADAQYKLGVMYSNGRGAPQDDKEAVKWFRLAAEQGEAFAQQRLDAILKSQAGTAETAPQPARVVVNRLPRIGDPLPGEEAADVGQADEGEEESTEVAALEPSESTAVDVTDGDAESAPVVVEGSGALYANSVPFDRVDGEPVMAVVLIDDPNANTNLGALPISVTIAVASDSVGSVQRAQQHRKAGREVVLIPPITGSDSRTDIARRLTEAMQNIPEAVAVMDMPGQAFQRSRFAVGEVSS